jgi:hypothetical protein
MTLIVERCRCHIMLATALLSHASDGAIEVTWSWCNVAIESCR